MAEKSKPAPAKKRLRWEALQRAIYLRQLHVMVAAGIPIHQATDILTENDEHRPEVRDRLEEIPKDLERGRLLSKSLERSRLFGRLVVSHHSFGRRIGTPG